MIGCRERPFVMGVAACVVIWAAAAGSFAAPPAPPRRVPIGLNRVPRPGNAVHQRWAKELQLNFLHEITQWLEPKPGQYVWAGGKDEFGAHLRKLKKAGYAISLTLTNVHMDHKHLPKYLAGRRFDDAYLLKRWEAYLEGFLERYGESIDFLNIGNEVNSYFGKHRKEWAGYVRFVAVGARLVKKRKPAIKIGVVLVEDQRAAYWKAIAPYCDHLAVTYYTPCSMFGKSPTRNALDPKHRLFFAKTLGRALRTAGRKGLLITEVGCATHPVLDSSPQLQVKFIDLLFGWLRRNERRVLGMSWLAAQDWPYEGTKKALKGQLDARLLRHEPFMRFLTSLGLRYEDGRRKPGYDAFQRAIQLYRRGGG